MAVNSAIISFNEGPLGIQDVLKRLNICPGTCFEQISVKCTKDRVKNIQSKSSEKKRIEERSSGALGRDFLIRRKKLRVKKATKVEDIS